MPVIQVYAAGESNFIDQCFQEAKIEFNQITNHSYTFNSKKVTEIARDWTMDYFFDWLDNGDASIIYCHPLQADVPPDWDYEIFMRRLEERFQGKIIFPSLNHGVDCVVTQDKFAYLERCKDICNPSYKIKCEWQNPQPNNSEFDCRIWEPILTESVKKQIFEFAEANYEIDDDFDVCGWVVKAPFTTGGKRLKYCKNIAEIYQKSLQLFRVEEFCGRMPYLILQPRMKNQKEVKVAWTSNPYTGDIEGPFIACNTRKKGCSYACTEAILDFAKDAKRIYEDRFPEHLTYPVFRIDIFRRQCGQFVVNEFESLEAGIGANERCKTIVTEFWLDELLSIDEAISLNESID